MAISTSKDCPHCGSNHKSKPFAIYENGYHCFSCGATKNAERNFQHRAPKLATDIMLPQLTRNPSQFSVTTLKWLRSYHMTDSLISQYGIAEAEDNSLIMPVSTDNQIVMYQRRWFNPRRIMTYGAKTPFITTCGSGTIAIVEDFISAVRVSEITDACCMFGTALPYVILESLVQKYNTIIVWADSDKAGQSAATKLIATIKSIIHRRLIYRAFLNESKQVRNVITKLDPKCLTKTEISNVINLRTQTNEENTI